MAALAFKYFPAMSWRPSGVYAEFDPSQANTAPQNQRALIVGQVLAAGTATPNVPVLAYSQDQVNALCGVFSMLALMYAAYRLQDPYGEVWILPVADAGGGIAGTQTLTLGGAATAAGALALYINGVPIPVAVNSGDAASAIASNVVTAVNLAPVPATAGAVGAVVTLTVDHKGVAVADMDVRLNYYGIANGEVLPAGLTAVVAAGVAGTTNPTFTTALANLGTMPFDFIVWPYTDATSMVAIEGALSDQSGRWSAVQMLYGHAFTAFRGTVGTRATFGTGRNSQHVTCLGYYDSPTPIYIAAADFAGAHAARIRVNPAQGVAEQALNLMAPPLPSQDSVGNRNTLLWDGVSTFYVDAAGVCRIDRSVTMYQKNAAGAPDDSYLNTNLLFQAAYAARYIAARLASEFIQPGRILVSDGTAIPMGAPAVTPSVIFQAVCGYYAYLASIFIVQNLQSFSRNGYAQPGSKGQVQLFLPFDFADQVIQIAALIQFRQST
jgi:phage tail sheath gpL-like